MKVVFGKLGSEEKVKIIPHQITTGPQRKNTCLKLISYSIKETSNKIKFGGEKISSILV